MKNMFKTSAIAAALLLAAGAAQAGTVIYNTGSAATAAVALGVNDDGSLNTDPNITCECWCDWPFLSVWQRYRVGLA
jgi:hypothetical protein